MLGKKILVTGPNGVLGSTILKSLDSNFTTGFFVDIEDSKQVRAKLLHENPGIIIHTAAYTDVDGCEALSDKAYKVNALGTQGLVNYCIGRDVLFIYISSTGVYGSFKDHEPYNEFDEVLPTTVHHKSKYEGEKIVRNHLSKYLILRTGWLFGGKKSQGKNFVFQRLLEAKNNSIIYSDDSQIGNPTCTYDLVSQIKVLISNNQYGIFNCVNRANNTTRYDYVNKIVDFSSENCQVKVAPPDMYSRMAPVSNNESAINYKLDLLGLNNMGNWKKSLDRYIKKIESKN